MAIFFENGKIPFIRWTGEFIVVLLGVLGALAVDNYRENRTERALERNYLESLYEDTIEASERANSLREGNIPRIDAAIQLINWMEGEGSPSNIEDLRSTIGTATSGGGASRESVTWQVIVSNGHVRLIRNRELRRQLITHAAARSGLGNMVGVTQDDGVREFRNGGIYHVLPIEYWAGTLALSDDLFPDALLALRSNAALLMSAKEMVVHRSRQQNFLLRLRDELDNIAPLLQAELLRLE